MSAVANAENNHSLDVNDLVVAEAYVGKNLVMKRFHARGRGRGSSIIKPFSQHDRRRPSESKQREEAEEEVRERSRHRRASCKRSLQPPRPPAKSEGDQVIWVKKSIPSAFASASTARGTAAGSPDAASTAGCCTRTRAIRAHIMKQQREAGISKVVIERPHKKCRVTVQTARPGMLIGKKGENIETPALRSRAAARRRKFT